MSSPYARPRLTDRRPAAAPSGAAAPAGPSLAEASADRDVTLIRIRYRRDARGIAYHDLSAFTAEYRRIWFDAEDYNADQATRAELIAWYTALHPDVDWTQDHQINLVTGAVYLAPEAWEAGFIPDEERTFGQPRPAVLLAARTAVAA